MTLNAWSGLPDPEAPKNLREGEPYNDPKFEELARTYGIWGTAQSALCAQFWQAARRATAAPVPQGLLEAAQRAHDWMDSQADSQSKGNFHSFDLLCLRQERDALAEALAAAPQPPEAAPVQLPEPWAISHHNRVQYSNAAWYEETPDGTKLYTEQQVRPLLETQKFQLDELAMLTRKLVRSLRKAAPDNESAEKALDYLKRKGLGGKPLRAAQEQSR